MILLNKKLNTYEIEIKKHYINQYIMFFIFNLLEKFKNEEIDSRVQVPLFSRYPFQKEFHVLLEVQA